MHKQKYIILGLLGCLLLFVYTIAIIYAFEKKTTFSEIHEINSDYKFISPILECNIDYNYYNPRKVKSDIEKYIKQSEKSENIDSIAYYVRLLKNGSNFGYNQNTKFIPASLVKLPFAISMMRELSLNDLNQTIPIIELPDNIFSGDLTPDIIKLGETHSLYNLLSEMLINSDNTATHNLFEYIKKIKEDQTYEKFGLGIVDFTTNNSLDISVKSYASFFRVLYNSSYLERRKSEELLSLLSKSTYNYGIRARLPRNIMIANKFGAQGIDGIEIHIHDCGVVYAESPYIICVMTKGKNREEQSKIIQNISGLVYNSIEKIK